MNAKPFKTILLTFIFCFTLSFLGQNVKAAPPFPAFNFEEHPDLGEKAAMCLRICEQDTHEVPRAQDRILASRSKFPGVDLKELAAPALDEEACKRRHYVFDGFMENLKALSDLATRSFQRKGAKKSFTLLEVLGELNEEHYIVFSQPIQETYEPLLREIVNIPVVLDMPQRLSALADWMKSVEELYLMSKAAKPSLLLSLRLNSCQAVETLFRVPEGREPMEAEVASINQRAFMKSWLETELSHTNAFVAACNPVYLYVTQLKNTFMQRNAKG